MRLISENPHYSFGPIVKTGDVGVVSKFSTDFYGNPMVDVDFPGHPGWHAKEYELELFVDYVKGAKVRMIAERPKHGRGGVSVGEVGVIISNPVKADSVITVKFPSHDSWSGYRDELALVSDAELAEETAREQYEEGDLVQIIETGEIMQVTDTDYSEYHDLPIFCTPLDTDDVLDGDWYSEDDVEPITLIDKAAEVGDRIFVDNPHHNYTYEGGDVLTVTETNGKGVIYAVEEKEIVCIAKSEYKVIENPKGDGKLEKQTYGNVFEVGDYILGKESSDERYALTNTEAGLMKVTDVVYDVARSIRVEILERKHKDLSHASFDVEPRYFRKATEEEVGRLFPETLPLKVGDLAKVTNALKDNGFDGNTGDIVRVIDTFRPSPAYGNVYRVEPVVSDRDVYAGPNAQLEQVEALEYFDKEKVAAGDTIIITDPDEMSIIEEHYEIGDVFVVDRTDTDNDVYITLANGKPCLVFSSEYEIIDKKSESEITSVGGFSVGDKVTEKDSGRKYEITQLDPECSLGLPVFAKNEDGGGSWFELGEIEHAEKDSETAETTVGGFAIGDKVIRKSDSTEYEIIEMEPGCVQDLPILGRRTTGRSRWFHPSEIEHVDKKPVVIEESQTIEVGDIVYFDEPVWFKNEGLGEVRGLSPKGNYLVRGTDEDGDRYSLFIKPEYVKLVAKKADRHDI